MAVAHVKRTAAGKFSGGTSATATFSGTVATGNAIIVAVHYSESRTISTLTDNSGNTYVAAGAAVQGAELKGQVFYALNVTGRASLAVNCTVSPGSYGFVQAEEVSGVALTNALDQYKSNTQASVGTSTDAITSGSVTTTTNGQYIFGYTFDGSNAAHTSAVGTGFTEGTGSYNNESGADGRVEYLIQSSGGSIAATFTTTDASVQWITFIATFKAAATSQDLTGDTLATSVSLYAATVKPNQLAHPDEDLDDGGWVTYYQNGTPGNNVIIFEDINDGAIADDTNMIRSAVAPSNDTVTFGLTSLLTPEAGTVKILVRARYYP